MTNIIYFGSSEPVCGDTGQAVKMTVEIVANHSKQT